MGPCLVPATFRLGQCVGNFCSMAEGIAVYRVNHPIDRISHHPFFLNVAALGLLEKDDFVPLKIIRLLVGHEDVLRSDMGVIILPKCGRIGDGAVVA